MVRRWDIITIGNVSRNRYWGEGDDRKVRSVICTSTLITGEGFRLLVDPPIADAEKMKIELDRRTGLTPADVDTVFITHAHGDHHAGLVNFRNAQWLAAAEVASTINSSGKYPKPVEPTEKAIRDGIEVIHTPGHTLDHHSLKFECDGMCVVTAGDAVMTRDFWNERRGFHNSADFALATKTMNHISQFTDIIIPGHDNYFLTARTPNGT